MSDEIIILRALMLFGFFFLNNALFFLTNPNVGFQ